MAVGFSNTNKPINPRGNDASPKGYNRAALYSGKALDFDGVNDNIQVSAFSTTGSTRSLSYFFKASASGNKRVFEIRSGSIFFNSTILDGKINTYDGSNGINTTKTFNDNKWHHVVVTHNGNNNAAIYVDGVSQELDASTFSVHDITNQTLYIGGLSGVYYDGGLSNLRLFNVALTAAQVSDLYNNPEKIVPTGVEDTALKLWLPMMEGAGTTAYDGSGNGNHGTISGATYVNGVGAPVAQSAVMDWNKGQNVINKSESFLSSYYSNQNITVTADQITAPDGDNNGYKFVASNANTFHLCNHSATVSAGVYTQSIFAKAGEYEHIYLVLRTDGGTKRYGVKFDLSDGTFVDDENFGSATNTGYAISDAGNGWYRCSVTSNHSSGNIIAVFGPSLGGNIGDINNVFQGDGTSGIYAWGLQAEPATSVGAYIPNPSETRITSDVLLPQGLTSGRDITGVNLFENVRKQGALNLDGNSWAEVHDNASLDVSAVTLECWIYNPQDGATSDGLLGSWKSSGTESYLLFKSNDTQARFYVGISNSVYNITSNANLTSGWNHIAGSYDGANLKIYLNGSLDKTQAQTGTLDTSSDVVEIGRYGGASGTSYNDQIAQPRIYNRALTAEEVLRNYNSGKSTYQ